MSFLVYGVAGLLFGSGLVISGMLDPAKVLNFLDFAGSWDPSLAFVLGGAVIVAAIGFRIAGRRTRPILARRFHWPTRSDIDARLLIGPAIFGIGWGLSGFCPGPAVASLALLAPGTIVFVVALLAGMALARRIVDRKPASDVAQAEDIAFKQSRALG